MDRQNDIQFVKIYRKKDTQIHINVQKDGYIYLYKYIEKNDLIGTNEGRKIYRFRQINFVCE